MVRTRIILILLFGLLFALNATPASTVIGTVSDAAGGLLANGTITFKLSQEGTVIDPLLLLQNPTVTCTITTGVITACSVRGNDEISPAGTVYEVQIFDADGITLLPPRNYSITGATWDIGTQTPNPSSVQTGIHGASLHSGDVIPPANQELGAFYFDFGEIAVPANPGANVRRVFTSSVTGQLSVRTNAGTTVSLEAAGGGGGAPTGATYITQTADPTLSAEQNLDALASGIMRVDTAAGVITSLTDSAGIAANLSDETGTGLLVFQSSPTIVTPTIAATGWTNATHAHAAANSGGQVAHTALSGIVATDHHADSILESELTTIAQLNTQITDATIEVQANKNAVSGYAGLDGSSKLTASQGQEVWALSDLTDVASTTGTGTIALLNNTPTIITPSFTTGFTIGGVAATDNCLIGNSTNFVASAACALSTDNLSFFAATTIAQLATLLSDENFTPGSEASAEAVLDLADLREKDIDSLTGQANWGTAATKETADLIINGVEVDFEAGAAEGYPRIAQSPMPPATGCDVAAEIGRLYFDTDADTDGSLMVCAAGPAWKEVDDDGAGGGEANTHSSDGGGLALTAATPKVGVDLRLVSLAAADFDLAADLFTIDDTKWAKDSELHTIFSPNADPGVDHSGLSGDVGITEVAGALSFNAAEIGTETWLDNADRVWTFDIAAAGVNPTIAFAASSIEVDANLTVDDEQELRLKEEDAGGENYVGFKAPATVTANGVCALLDSTTDIIPDTCVGGILADELIALGSEISGTLDEGNLDANVVLDNAANTYSTGAQDFSSATSLTTPVAAGAAPTVSGQVAYDSTASQLEYGDNTVNRVVVNLDEAQTLSNKTLGPTNVVQAGAYDLASIDGDDLATGLAGVGLTLTPGAPDVLDCDAASTTAVGCPEMAIASEVNTGTSTILAVTPDALAGSTFGQDEVQMILFDFTTAVATGDGAFYFPIPTSSKLIGKNLVGVYAWVTTVSSSGAITVDIARCAAVATGNPCSGTVADVLSTDLTIDANEDSSDTAAAAAVINTANDDAALDVTFRFDVDGAGTGTQGLAVALIFQKP